jgi:sugar phosphate isomerase/epimerase
MRLGFLTACLPTESLSDIAAWAATAGYQGLEVAVWPDVPGRDWEASHLDLDGFGPARADDVRAMLDQHGLEISALAYYENNLHADPAARHAAHEHLRRVVDAAAALDCGLVGTFVGRDVTATVADNLELGATVFGPLVDYAGERGVRLVVENCPMEGWHPDGYPANLAYSPELWEWMASLGLYLNWDPSHLQWLGIDPVEVITPYADQILHVQAKDTEVDAAARNRYGLFGRTVDRSDPWDSGWWRYRIPGLGDVEWRRVVDRLYQAGFDGFVSVEHEDPIWSGTPDKVRKGLTIAHRTLAPLLVD